MAFCYDKYVDEKIREESPTLDFMSKTITDVDLLLESDETSHKMELLCFCIQKKFCKALESLETDKKFKTDIWYKPNNCGGGISCVIQDGKVIEKGGVNISVITGELSRENAIQIRSRGYDFNEVGNVFKAVGISSVIHPLNPHCPTIHFNFRYFQVTPKTDPNKSVWWFGGGIDITPYYVYPEDMIHFHKSLKEVCDKNDPNYHKKFKKWADEYFYIPHREETRGMGGIFFDDLTAQSPDLLVRFICDCAFAIVPAYIPIIEKRKNLFYGPREIEWKHIRRGRYVEFNLMYDRGTKFGLATPGSRIESILMSLPAIARWEYCHTPQPNGPEEALLTYTRKPIDWV